MWLDVRSERQGSVVPSVSWAKPMTVLEGDVATMMCMRGFWMSFEIAETA